MFRLVAFLVISLLFSNTAFAHGRHWGGGHDWRHGHHHRHHAHGHVYPPRFHGYPPPSAGYFRGPERYQLLPPPAGYYGYPRYPHQPSYRDQRYW